MKIQQFADKYRLKVRVDVDGTRIVNGKYGHIYEYDDGVLGVMIMPKPKTLQPKLWAYARRAFIQDGFTIRQNGDLEGAATFDPSNVTQVRLALKYAKIKTRRIMSEKQAEVLKRARESSPFMRKRQLEGKDAPIVR